MNTKQLRIGDLAQALDVKKFVIRFWEKEFNLNAQRSDGGQRFYDEQDLETFIKIKTLLYDEKFTIPGAREQLKRRKQNNCPDNRNIGVAYKDHEKKIETPRKKAANP